MKVKEFNLDRLNEKKIQLGEQPIELKRTTYPEVVIEDGYLVDEKGNRIGTKGDANSDRFIDEILQRGCLDEDPRPVFIDTYDDAKYYKDDLIIVTKTGEEVKIDSTALVIEKDNEIEVRSKAHTQV